MKFVQTLLIFGACHFTAATAYAQNGDIAELLEAAINSSPSILIAESDFSRAAASADKLNASPYQYRLSASAGRHFINEPLTNTYEFSEFGAGVLKTIRLPNKRRMDARLADIEIELARLSAVAVRADETFKFAALWNAWVEADSVVDVSSAQALRAKTLADIAKNQVDHGAGRQIDADLSAANAQIADVKAQQDRLASEGARLNLLSRYPGLSLPPRPSEYQLPLIAPNPVPDNAWTKSPQYQLAVLGSEKLRLQSERLALDKRPDPTLGLEVKDEFGGREQTVLATISIPIGGSMRKAATRETLARANTAELEARLSLEALKRNYSMATETARLSMAALASANSAKTASGKALARIESGYDIKAITLQELLNAQSAHNEAERVYAQYLGKSQAALFTVYVYEKNLK